MLRWLMLILLLLAAPSALAQESTGETTDVEALIATLEDEAEREALIETLETLIAADQQTEVQPGLSGRILDALSERVERVGHQLSQTAGLLSSLPAATDRLITGAGDAATRVRWLRITLKIVFVITLAWLSRTMLHRMLKSGREKLEKRTGDSVLEATILFLGRVIYGYLPIAVFAAVAPSGSEPASCRATTALVSPASRSASVSARIASAMTPGTASYCCDISAQACMS